MVVIGQLEPASVPELIGMARKWHPSCHTEPLDQFMEADGSHGPLRSETNTKPFVGLVSPPQPPQCPNFVPPNGMDRGSPVLGTAHMEATLVQLDLVPLQPNDFGCPEPNALSAI